jgi:hypothetical protein
MSNPYSEPYTPPFVHLSLLSRHATPRTKHYQQTGIFKTPGGDLLGLAAIDDNPTSGEFVVEGTESIIFRSEDGGATWDSGTAFTGYCITCFSVGSDVYAFTTTEDYGSVQIRKSTDDGATWGSATTLITGPGYYVVPPSPLVAGGRVYVPILYTAGYATNWVHGTQISLLHASDSADLMVSGSWTRSSGLALSGGSVGSATVLGWWEPNLFLDANGDAKMLCRVKADFILNVAALIDVTLGASASLSYNTSTGIRALPGGHSFFKVMLDPVTDEYLIIAQRNTIGADDQYEYNQRTIMQLVKSADLSSFTQVADLIREPQFDQYYKAVDGGWQYFDSIIDGDDIIGVIRVGEYGIALNNHQASAMYFYRLKDYYKNLLAPAPANSGTSPSSPYAAVTRNGVAV